MRLVTVDNGNSHPNVGFFQNEKLQSTIPLNEYRPLPDDIILMSDVGLPLPFKASFDLKTKRHTKDHSFFFDMPVHYTETLGDDRLFSAYRLFKQITNSNEKILSIDAGTFIKTDVISHQGFLGGFIFPGIKIFLASYQNGAKLPLIVESKSLTSELPQSTEEAIMGAADLYLDSLLESTIKKTSPIKIVITGGSSELIKNKIEKLSLKVPLEMVPHSIHLALALIYQTHLRPIKA